jgi:uncharacterized protein (DUF1810 family)
LLALPVTDGSDPYQLSRFVEAQRTTYHSALEQIANGRKVSHWMWYVFPQLDGLGFSATATRYAIKTLAEARAYLAHPILGPRLVACAEAMLAVEGRSAREILGSPDDLKLRSCATLFAEAAGTHSVFHDLLERYFGGVRDDATLQLLRKAPAG